MYYLLLFFLLLSSLFNKVQIKLFITIKPDGINCDWIIEKLKTKVFMLSWKIYILTTDSSIM